MRGRKPCLIPIYFTGEVRHEEQIEMGQVIGYIFVSQDQVACQFAIWGWCHTLHSGKGSGGRDRLGDRTDTTDTRHIDQCIHWILALQHLFEAAIKG